VKSFVLRGPEQYHALRDHLRANAGPQASAGKPLLVTVDVYYAKRSSEQNRLFHALLNTIAENATVGGKYFDAETWKEHIRRRFIGTEEINLPDGSRLERGISTASLTVPEFTLLIERVQAWAQTELNVEF
jgi:hypothetical protein